jgi:hypothetical protein
MIIIPLHLAAAPKRHNFGVIIWGKLQSRSSGVRSSGVQEEEGRSSGGRRKEFRRKKEGVQEEEGRRKKIFLRTTDN